MERKLLPEGRRVLTQEALRRRWTVMTNVQFGDSCPMTDQLSFL